MAGTPRSWERGRNATDHVFTNVIGKDGDFGYRAFRFSNDVAWSPIHLAQPLLSPLSGLLFEYMIGAYDIGLLDHVRPGRTKATKRRSVGDLVRDLGAFVKKATRVGVTDYVVYP